MARPHCGAPSPRDTQPHAPHAPDGLSVFYQAEKSMTSESTWTPKRERGKLNAQEHAESSDGEKEGQETEDDGYFVPR